MFSNHDKKEVLVKDTIKSTWLSVIRVFLKPSIMVSIVFFLVLLPIAMCSKFEDWMDKGVSEKTKATASKKAAKLPTAVAKPLIKTRQQKLKHGGKAHKKQASAAKTVDPHISDHMARRPRTLTGRRNPAVKMKKENNTVNAKSEFRRSQTITKEWVDKDTLKVTIE